MDYVHKLKGSPMPEDKKKVLADSRAIRKLKSLIADDEESMAAMADNLGCARGTLGNILAGLVEPRFDVMKNARKHYNISLEDWGRS
jgi:hypothetical protein